MNLSGKGPKGLGSKHKGKGKGKAKAKSKGAESDDEKTDGDKAEKGVTAVGGVGTAGKKKRRKKMSVSDPIFHARLKKLLRIVIPGIRSREAAMLALHTCFLLARTALSLYVADLDGR